MIGKKKKVTPENTEMEQNISENQVVTDNKDLDTNRDPEIVSPENNLQNIEAEITGLKKDLDDQRDKYLRLFAEFDNFRKRTIKEKLELSKTAAEDIIVALLPVLDDMGRALKNMDDSAEILPVKEGITLIYNKFNNILKIKGLEPIEAEGKDFDTDFHDAIAHVPVEDAEKKGKVIDETEKGYTLNGKVIRHSRVVVGQ